MNILLINGAQEDGSISKAFINSFILKAKLKRKGNKEQIIYNKCDFKETFSSKVYITMLKQADVIIFNTPIIFYSLPVIVKMVIESTHEKINFIVKEKQIFLTISGTKEKVKYSISPLPEYFALFGSEITKTYELQEQKDIDKAVKSLIKTLKI